MVLGDGAMRAVTAFTAFAAVLIMAALLSGCGDSGGAETLLPLPDASSVERILPSTQTTKGSAISDPKRITKILGQLEDLRADWELVTDANMIPTESIVSSSQFSGADNTILLLLWVGDDWIGANDMQGGTSVRQPFVDPQRGNLLRSLGS